MLLDSGGRVLLKIYNSKGQLLISKPCTSREFAELWLKDYCKGKPEASEFTNSMTEMVPRI